jgi:hypothetical protein
MLPLKMSGLGLRPSSDFASAAFIASRVSIAPLAATIAPSLDVLARASACLASCHRLATIPVATATVMQRPAPGEKVQKNLTAAMELHKDTVTLEFASIFDKARLQATRAPWANAYLHVTHDPDRPTQWLSSAEFRLVIRFRLGLTLADTATRCPMCGGRFLADIYGLHATTCMGGGVHNSVHFDVLSEFHRVASTALMQPTLECCPFPDAAGHLRIDMMCRNNVGPSPITTDVAITSALQNVMLPFAAAAPAGAATKYEAVKITKYRAAAERNGMRFFPLVVDTFGGFGAESLPMALKIARAWGRRVDVPHHIAQATVMTAISLRLQRGIARLLATTSTPPPEVSG